MARLKSRITVPSGLGLAVVHGIITSHRGAITVTSTPGQGTTVVVYLPRLETEIPHRAPPPGTPLPAGTERILFVDDEDDDRSFQFQMAILEEDLVDQG